jgi:hypothetical protein
MKASEEVFPGCGFRICIIHTYATKGGERLSAAERQAVDDHLEECPTCRSAYWKMRGEKIN